MPETRIIKRYANRKLYDTEHSRYVTLEQISEMIRAGDDVKIVDNKTKEDLTTVTLAQIIFEEEKKQRSFLPLAAMRNIIQSGGQWFAEAQRRVQSILPVKLRHEGGTDATDEATPLEGDGSAEDEALMKKRSLASLREWVEHSKQRLDDFQKSVDSKVRGAIENVSHAITPWNAVHRDVRALADRIAELEAKLHELDAHEAGASEPVADLPAD
jgi:polyhydroxyalkanoate synthesis repressor PhaR